MLTGGFEGVIDAKSRVVLPSKLRSALGDDFHLMMGFGPYVAIYPQENYEEMLSQLMSMKKSSNEYLTLGRYLLGNAFDGDLDSAGRVLIPPVLRKHGDLEKEVRIMGVGDHIEIWSKENYEKNCILSEESLNDARQLMNY